ncbi:TrbI/VirB10 family protein [Sphingomonas sp. GB1N7]|uniref:TrbI/VirB10 family protein n=1 Tax=Parasphingomonas caseinilytica TaxID=3096158 RepID=UPI002FC640BA
MRPLVARAPRALPWWIFAGGIAIAAILLFSVLNARRAALTAPALRTNGTDSYGRAAVPPPFLFVPPEPAPPPLEQAVTSAPRITPPIFLRAPAQPGVAYAPPAAPPILQQPILPAPAPPTRKGNGDSVLVYDATQAEPADAPAPASGGSAQGATSLASADRVRSTTIRHQATTVPQGTLIPAVLETALDSTRPGLARALVQDDVRGFDGSQILIQRGSRLIGEYRADLQPGQNRAGVMWTRLVRPDGVTIALQSPAADQLGRGGIKGSVNSHFFSRFATALLQTSLDIGVALASRAGGNSSGVYIGAVPGLANTGTSALLGNNRAQQPTLTVRQGTAISVFVSRDLDFTGVAGSR